MQATKANFDQLPTFYNKSKAVKSFAWFRLLRNTSYRKEVVHITG